MAVDGGAAPGIAGTKPYVAVAPTVATDVVVPGTPGSAGPPIVPPIPGSHTITYTAPYLLTSEVVKYSGTVPNLTYFFGIPGNGVTFNYNEIDIVGATYTGTAPTTVAVELTGGSGTSFYDVRLICGGAPLSATAENLRCLFPTNGIYPAPSPVPSYYIANSYGAPSGTYTTSYTAPVPPATVGTYGRPAAPGAPPALLYPTATGTFTATAPTAYVVLGFAAGTTGGVLSFAALEAIQ